MIIDTALEWAVIFSGILLAVMVAKPTLAIKAGEVLTPPHPAKVREWLRRVGL